ncbi:MAG TPA: SMP-30/gluconolactonase/LRE family protein [Candidatus Nanopelagicaceae bacterium]|nr:SMP-30/gluconolactonase/LRE family protein [Candidatus Nanopelagicaceae bacterium]
MTYDVFDERRCQLGEGPSASGTDFQQLSWVDVSGCRVLSHDMATGLQSEFSTSEQVSFAIPRENGGYVLGLANGPVLLDSGGQLETLPGRREADGIEDPNPIRWNDAKVSPSGELWLGTMTYEFLPGKSALYRMSRDGRSIARVLSDLTVSNGIGWSPDGTRMFFIDSPKRSVTIFDVDGSMIRNERTLIDVSNYPGVPDGLCVDSAGGVWVAFWEGSAIRRFDGLDGSLTEEFRFAASRITSCAFGGPALRQLFVTSAREDSTVDESAEAGMTFVVEPGVSGLFVNQYFG